MAWFANVETSGFSGAVETLVYPGRHNARSLAGGRLRRARVLFEAHVYEPDVVWEDAAHTVQGLIVRGLQRPAIQYVLCFSSDNYSCEIEGGDIGPRTMLEIYTDVDDVNEVMSHMRLVPDPNSEQSEWDSAGGEWFCHTRYNHADGYPWFKLDGNDACVFDKANCEVIAWGV